MNSKNIVGLVKFFIYTTFFVPLAVMPTSFIFPFIVPKILLFRSLTVLIVAGYALLLATKDKDYWPKTTPLTIAVFTFLISFTLSTLFGVDSYHSFWDNHERMLGLFTIFHYIAYFFICSQVFKTWSDWKWALRIFLVAGSLVMLIGCMQIADPNFLLNGGSPRIISTLGNAIYVGGYGLFLLFVATLLFLKDTNIVWRWAEVGGAFLAIIGLFYSGTRGSMLGLAVGLGVMLLSYVIVLKEYPRTRYALVGLAMFSVIAIGLLYVNRGSQFVKSQYSLNHLFNTSLSELTGGARVIAWGVAIESWKEKPIFGWGPNNFFYAFNKHYNPQSLDYGYGETWFDNAHNIILNTMAVQGAFGIVSYLAIFIVGVWTVYSLYRREQMDKHIAILTAAFLIAHLVQNITVFENPTSYLYFMFWLALINGFAVRSKKKIIQSTIDKKMPVLASPNKTVSAGYIIGAIALAAVFIFILNIQPARANMKALYALQVVNADPVGAIPAIEDALHFSSPHVDDIRNDVSHVIISAISDTNQKISDDKKIQLETIVSDALISNLLLHPLDIRIHLSLSQMYQNVAVQKNSVQAMMQAEKYLQEALALSPRRQQIMYNLAIVQLQLGKSDQAIALFDQTINDNPMIAESYIRLGYTYLSLKKPELAKATLERADKNGVVYNEQEQQSVNQIIATFLAPQTNSTSSSPVKKK